MTDKKIPGLYIHVPFCITKCPYCDFYSIDDIHLTSAWLDAIGKEIFHYVDRFSRFDTLYLGGGTPTLLSPHQIARLMDYIKKHFNLTSDSELTIEANPNDLTFQKTQFLYDLGFNRISLGVQSFDEKVLKFLKRRHTVVEAIRAIECIRKAGFENLSIDLMYAIPGQTIESWKQILRQAITFMPEHISCYQLTAKKETPLWNLKEKDLIQFPDEAKEEAFFLATTEFLKTNGYLQYEVSNFARDSRYYSIHNCKYWQHLPYLGLGPSAHSFLKNTRWWNYRTVNHYVHSLEKGCAPIEGMENLTDEQRRLEALSLKFRTNRGLDLSSLRTYQGIDDILAQLVESKLVEIIGNRVIATTKGLLVADSIPLLFG